MFGIESRFYKISCLIYKFVVLNLLFLLTSLIVITIPAGFSALIQTLDSSEHRLVRDYFKYFKQSILKTIPIGIFNIFSILSIYALLTRFIYVSLLIKLFLIISILFIFSYNILLYLIQSEQYDTWMNLFRNTFLVTIVNFHKIVFSAIGVGIVLLVSETFIRNITLIYAVSLVAFTYKSIFSKFIMQYTKRGV